MAEATILTQEAGASLRRYLETLDIDPARQDEMERRAAALESPGPEHRVGVLELPEQSARIEQEVDALDNVQVSLAALESRSPRPPASIAAQRKA